MLFIQYLSISIAFMVLALISARNPKVGLILRIILGLFFTWFFRSAVFSVVGIMIALPILFIGFLYFYGRPKPQKWAYRLIYIFPIIIVLVIIPLKIHQVSQRVDDGNFGMRLVEGNGVNLLWAPRGPGWPDKGVTYAEAIKRCKYLSEDGTKLMNTEQNIWHLPSVEEAVSSMMLHNVNAGGTWNPDTGIAYYNDIPDKETPLWDPHSQIIYYWIQSKDDSNKAYIITYNGGVFTRYKDKSYGYLSFRAVKDTTIKD